VSQGSAKATSPTHSRPNHHHCHRHIGSIYRKTLSKKHLNSSTTTTMGRKSLFDDSDNDEESDGSAISGKCRLTHKFSSDSLFLFYEQQQQQQQQQQQNFEDRGEQEDESERKVSDECLPNERSFSIRKASAIYDEYDNDEYYYYLNIDSNNTSGENHYAARQLLIPEHRSSRPSIHRHAPPADLYLPTL
jgi:hypothetical protein